MDNADRAVLSELRERIHSALEFLYRFGEQSEPNIDYRRAFAATDTLLDVEEAFSAFGPAAWPESIGIAYLLFDGVLQSLIKQQDAVASLASVFEVPWKPHTDPALQQIRRIRVQASGHPVHHDENKPDAGSTFLIRDKPGKFKISVGTFLDRGSYKNTTIDLMEMINTQEHQLSSVLRLIWATILYRHPDAAHFRWNPWVAEDHYPKRLLIIDAPI